MIRLLKKHTLFLEYILTRRNFNMPYVTVKMLEGRTEEQKKALVEKVTAAVVETTGASTDKVVVFIEEMSKSHYAVGGKRLSDE
ncbi:2-hydroxymuconate tautomerase [Lederbergia citri]|uniref:2-hydroxymuconate tautomerase n=1 Tax=Lederbergia citri TaxID=2833580 RepID=UPI0022790AF8|nr:2-hydroxymuconate tautomerase [Lederbergia citri]